MIQTRNFVFVLKSNFQASKIIAKNIVTVLYRTS